MSGSADQFEELGLLIAALCDGQITPHEAARLERLASQSDQSRRYFLNYLQLHGELHWDHAAAARRETPLGVKPAVETQFAGTESAQAARTSVWTAPPRKMGLVLAALAAAVLVIVVGWWTVPGSASRYVARLSGTAGAKWSHGDSARLDGGQLVAGQQLGLREGLAEITFDSGARVILQAPATFDVTTASGGFLHAGRLVANVPAPAAGFAIRTPNATIVDVGTEFGVAVKKDGSSEIHVFAGAVEFQAKKAAAASGRGTRLRVRRLRAGQAVSVVLSEAGSTPEIHQIALAGGSFVRALPAPGLAVGSVAKFRHLVAGHPNLIHHYTFEGTTKEEKRQDKRGDLHLIEVVMSDGDGGGSLDYSADGFDATTNAIRPARARWEGNTNGVSMQSRESFHPPETLTVELLLNFDGFTGEREGVIAAAVATRASQEDCGFLVVVVEGELLAHLMDGDALWVEADGFPFIPGEWYYVASTFRVDSGKTTVNSYVANLSRHERTLRQVVKDRVTAGVPAASRLGIGKAFDKEITHAYPWPGALDEVAVYDAVLDEQTLEEHLMTLVGGHRVEKTGS